ncbi:MAG: type II toxin-antitoxin system VapC family toxin [Deltaproteobacteria bacterium]|nr:type II toxin-antitoxin system VapC family toxin [Deltaproteobacteria bacterium]
MKFLLDTNVCIDMIRGRPGRILSRLRRCRPGDVGISSITLAELWHGVAKSRNPEGNAAALEGFLLPLEVLDFGEEAALAYGSVRASLEKTGTPIGSMDTLIAAHAASLGATVVTSNTREFRRVRSLDVVDWTR